MSISGQENSADLVAVKISREARNALSEMAQAAGVSQRQFAELLLNYAYSIHRRPGSWEAGSPFDVTTYTRPDTVADRWWDIPARRQS